MYVYFDVDENNMLDILHKLILPSKVDVMAQKGGVPVLMGLADEKGFPHKGDINFSNTWSIHRPEPSHCAGVFENPGNALGKRLLRPGMFVRVRLPLGKPHMALLVSEKALGTDQGKKYVFVVNGKNIVEYRRVTNGPSARRRLGAWSKESRPTNGSSPAGCNWLGRKMEVKIEPEPMPKPTAQNLGPRANSRLPSRKEQRRNEFALQSSDS